MDDTFTITLTYNRREIIAMAEKVIAMGADIFKTKEVLDMFYLGWSRDSRTMCMVELMFRDENDVFYDLFTRKLAELDETDRVALQADTFGL